MKYYHFILIAIVSLSLTACEQTTEDFVTETYESYYPLQVGKYITYRLDSLVFVQSGSVPETHRYMVKHTISAEITDASGRKAFLVNKLINNENGSGPWLENGNYTVTPLADQVEVNEDNLRVIKLHNPFKLGFGWKGNAYLPTSPYRPAYDMDAGSEMNTWTFSYSNNNDTTVNGHQYQNVWTVLQNEFVLNLPPTPGVKAYGLMEVGKEQYSKNIGLVFKDYKIYEYQPGHADNGEQPSYTGFGITMWMVDHN
ncbi:MAG: hypothetical protein ACK5NK_09785 [Niabella sp.]